MQTFLCIWETISFALYRIYQVLETRTSKILFTGKFKMQIFPPGAINCQLNCHIGCLGQVNSHPEFEALSITFTVISNLPLLFLATLLA